MREGVHIVYKIQFRTQSGDRRWSKGTNAASILFDGLSHEDSHGALGADYRRLLDPEHACWQVTGVTAYLDQGDARATMAALRRVDHKYEYRVVRQFLVQHTTEV